MPRLNVKLHFLSCLVGSGDLSKVRANENDESGTNLITPESRAKVIFRLFDRIH